MKARTISIIALCLLTSAGICYAQTPLRGGELVVCQPAEPPGLDPTGHTEASVDRVVYANIFEGLIKVNSKGELTPGLAARWNASPGGTVYTFYLRKNVKFHNG